MKKKFTMLVGLPGAGKSTYAKKEISKNKRTIWLSSDNIRQYVFGDVDIQAFNAEVFQIMEKAAIAALNKEYSVIYDATNLSSKRREALLKVLSEKVDKDFYKEVKVFCPLYKTALGQNQARWKTVPEKVMKRMLLSFNCPSEVEGWQSIDFINGGNYDIEETYQKIIEEYKDYDQNNPYHTLTLAGHIDKSVKNYEQMFYNKTDNPYPLETLYALKFHDIGKPIARITKSDGISHYYNHPCASSYYFLSHFSHLPKEQLIRICKLIEYHMLGKDLTAQGAKRRGFEEGSGMWVALQEIYYCDKSAH